jgi:hypothetical protein
MTRLLIVLAILTVSALAADVTGTYKGEIQTSSGKAANTVVLTAKGSVLTGTVSNQMGTFPIENGSVEGDDLFFSIRVKDDGDDLKITYRGHSFGAEIQFRVEAGERTLLLAAKKVQ